VNIQFFTNNVTRHKTSLIVACELSTIYHVLRRAILINADSSRKLTTSYEIEHRFYARRWKLIIRHYRSGNGYTACLLESGFSLRCDYVYCPFRPTSRKSRKRHVRWPREICDCRFSCRLSLMLLSFRSYEADKNANYLPVISNICF